MKLNCHYPHETEPQSFTQEARLFPQGCYTIAELFDRYILGEPLPDNSSRAIDDTDIYNPVDVYPELTDVPTIHDEGVLARAYHYKNELREAQEAEQSASPKSLAEGPPLGAHSGLPESPQGQA